MGARARPDPLGLALPIPLALSLPLVAAQVEPLHTTGTSTFLFGSTSISRTSSGIAPRIATPQIGQRIWYPCVAPRYGLDRSIASPASGAPISSPIPFVVVARPEAAPRCSTGTIL